MADLRYRRNWIIRWSQINPGMNGVDWNALVRDRRDQILACTDPEVFEKEVHKLLAELKTSHTGFRHAGMRNIPARHAINATLQRIGVNGSERWMFQDVHQGGPAFAAGIRPGDLLLECGGREVRPPNDLTFSVGESADLLIEKLHGQVQKVNVQLPMPKSQKHYEALLSALPDGANATQFLREELPFRWRDLYVSSVARPTNLVRFQFRTFEYICDLYSELEATGEVPYDQTIEDRVVAVIGTSARAEERRDASRSRGWVGDRPKNSSGQKETKDTSWRTASAADST